MILYFGGVVTGFFLAALIFGVLFASRDHDTYGGAHEHHDP